VKPSNVTSVNQVSGLGVPDIMGIVLPHIYTVLFPLILMVSALSAERAACRYHIGMAGKCHRQSGLKLSQWLLVFPTSEAYRGDASVGSSSKEMMSVAASKLGVVWKERCEPQPEGELETLLLNRKMEHQNVYCSLCNRLIRKGLLVGCLAITFLHSWVRFPSTPLNKLILFMDGDCSPDGLVFLVLVLIFPGGNVWGHSYYQVLRELMGQQYL
jgi:hypothetical protein